MRVTRRPSIQYLTAQLTPVRGCAQQLQPAQALARPATSGNDCNDPFPVIVYSLVRPPCYRQVEKGDPWRRSEFAPTAEVTRLQWELAAPGGVGLPALESLQALHLATRVAQATSKQGSFTIFHLQRPVDCIAAIRAVWLNALGQIQDSYPMPAAVAFFQALIQRWRAEQRDRGIRAQRA